MTLERLWSIRAKRSEVKCLLHVEPFYTELLVLQDEDVAVRQTFDSRERALAQASELRARLLALGWRALQ